MVAPVALAPSDNKGLMPPAGLAVTVISVPLIGDAMICARAEPPTFVSQVGNTWTESWGALTSVGQTAVLVAVALAPWAMVAFVPSLLAFAFYRLKLRPRTAA